MIGAVPLISFPSREYVVFLSSGDDALHLRNLVDDLVRESVNSELHLAGFSIRLLVDRWERTAPGRAAGETINSWFVRRARGSSLALCLLIERLGDGTKEEIEAVLDSDGVEISVIWFVDRTTWPMTEVGTFLDAHKGELYVDRAGPPDGDGATISLVRVLLHIVMQAVATHGRRGFRERR